MNTGPELAKWIRARLEYRREDLTHLKLQKLAFYCYGAALAQGVESEVEPIEFEAWAHGPVCPAIWSEYRAYKGNPIPWITDESDVPHYTPPCEAALGDALAVYGLLDAWSLRQESHLEQPWVAASPHAGTLSKAELRRHFVAKFASGAVEAPEYLLATSSAALDGIRLGTHRTLADLAQSVRRGRV